MLKTKGVKMEKGKVVQVIGPVVDVSFKNDLPEINHCLVINSKNPSGDTIKLTLEVALHLGDNVVRTIALDSTDGLARGMEVENTGAPIKVPVGECTLGRVSGRQCGDSLLCCRPHPGNALRHPGDQKQRYAPRP